MTRPPHTTRLISALLACACSTADSPTDPPATPSVAAVEGERSEPPAVDPTGEPVFVEPAEGPSEEPLASPADDVLADSEQAPQVAVPEPPKPPVQDAEPLSAEEQTSVDQLLAKVGDRDASPVPTLTHAKWFRHKLAPRERVSQVAYRYGVDLAQLREWNGLRDATQRLRIGARLKVHTARTPPHRERVTYTVVEGDTWWRVALRHGVDRRDLRAYNYPPRRKMTPGTELQLWIDPVVFSWIKAGGDPLPDDQAFALRRGSVGVGSPNNGTLLNGVRIPKGEGYNLRLPKSAYGTSHGVAQVLVALTIFRSRTDYALDLQLGAMSRPRGGELKGHKSHQNGRDLDIRLPRKVGVAQWRELTRRRVDWLATWALIDALLHTDVRVIFLDYAGQKQLYRSAEAAGIDVTRLRAVLQYPDGRSAAGIVRHSPGHEKHIHVRFGCGPYDVECID